MPMMPPFGGPAAHDAARRARRRRPWRRPCRRRRPSTTRRSPRRRRSSRPRRRPRRRNRHRSRRKFPAWPPTPPSIPRKRIKKRRRANPSMRNGRWRSLGRRRPAPRGSRPEDGRLERGRILWFDRDKNFGFIAAEVGGENVFIHGFDVKGFHPRSLRHRRDSFHRTMTWVVSFSILMLRAGDPRTSPDRRPKNDLCVFIRGRDVGGRLKANEAEVFPETGGPPPPRSWRPGRNLFNQECPCRRRRRRRRRCRLDLREPLPQEGPAAVDGHGARHRFAPGRDAAADAAPV